jgi:hypothetical protein
VAQAYGWPVELADAELLERLVALNRERAAEEAKGHIRWLRPEYQAKAPKRKEKPFEPPMNTDKKLIKMACGESSPCGTDIPPRCAWLVGPRLLVLHPLACFGGYQLLSPQVARFFLASLQFSFFYRCSSVFIGVHRWLKNLFPSVVSSFLGTSGSASLRLASGAGRCRASRTPGGPQPRTRRRRNQGPSPLATARIPGQGTRTRGIGSTDREKHSEAEENGGMKESGEKKKRLSHR